MKEYPSAAERLEAAYAECRGRCEIVETDAAGMQPHKIVQTVNFWMSHGYRKFEMGRTSTTRRPPMADIAFCFGGESGFAIEKPPGGRGYSVTRAGSERNEIRDIYNTNVGRYVEAAYFFYVRPLRLYLDRPSFRALAAEEVLSGGRTLLRVHCEDGVAPSVSRFSATLDPGDRWVIRGGEFRPGSLPRAVASFEVDYQAGPGGLPTPKRVTLREVNGVVSECVFKEFSFLPTPRPEFSMEHYGLPDISAARPPRPRPPAHGLPDREGGSGAYWMVCLAVSGLMTAALLAWRARAGER